MNLEVTYQNVFQKLIPVYGKGEAKALTDMIFRELGYSVAVRISHPNTELDLKIFDRIMKIVDELQQGRPLQYILGYTWFHDYRIQVSSGVLIPRPETEEMTDLILHEVLPENPAILDIGTGSGCIAVALAGKIKGSRLTAIDISERALEVASGNAVNNNVSINFIKADILSPPDFDCLFNLIVSNPPYVRYNEKAKMLANVLDHEPESALFVPDNDPLMFYAAIAGICEKNLASGGLVYVEINEALGKETARLFSPGLYSEIYVLKDMQKKDRFIKAVKR